MGWSKTACLMLLCALSCASTQAQTLSEWFRQKKTQIDYYVKQIAGLKAYNDLLVEGYGIVRDGLQLAHDIRKGEFDLHHDYFQSLRSVNASLKTDDAEEVYEQILAACRAVMALTNRVPATKREYVTIVIVALKEKAQASYHHYRLLTTPDEYQLTDDERLRRIDEAIKELHQQFAFAKRLHAALLKLIAQEARENNDSKALHKLLDR